MRRTRLALFFAFCAAGYCYAGREFSAGPSEKTAKDELLVKLKAGTAPSAVFSAIIPAAVVRKLHPNLDLYHLALPPGVQQAISKRLAADALTEYVEPNRIRTITIAAPNDPAYSTNQYDLAAINAVQAWGFIPDRYYTSSTATTGRISVAVVDTGADCTHPDFMNLGGFSTNSALGGQLLWGSSQALVATSIANPACPWLDDHGHGTHVSGTVAAATNNGQGVASIGYGLQVIEYRALGSNGTGTDANIASAIMSAADAGASVINLSFGAVGYSQTLQTAINYAWKRNAVVVAAAGNDNTNEPFFPAGGAHVVGVAATDSTNQRAAFSNFGPIVSLAAPGNLIYGLAPTYAGTTLGAQNYTTMSGTSMATPHVAGLAGLVRTTNPGAAADAIAQRMQQSARSGNANGGWDQNLGYGLIDAAAGLGGVLRPATVGGIRGQVVDVNENAVSSIAVTVAGTTITTDQSGFFRFFNLTAGAYVISATGGGFPNQTVTVGVAPGADTTAIVRMGVQLGTFTGHVLNGSAGVGGAVVQALSGGIVQSSTITAPDGSYSLSVPSGTYDLKASIVSGTPIVVTSRAITAGATVTVDLTVARLGTISGTAVDTTGAPVANAQITFTASNWVSGTTTDANGHYTSIGLSSGTYTVTGTAPSGASRTASGVVVSSDTVTTLNLVLGNFAPTTVSVNPNSGTGINQTFTLTYSDQDGVADLSYAHVLFNNIIDGSQSCYVYYFRPANVFYLFTDDAKTTLGPLAPGSTATIQNSQCTLNGQASSVTGSGNNLTVTVALTFSSTFTGTKNIYMNAQDASGATAGWTSRGTWTPSPLVNQPPTTVSVSPASGTGLNATLALTYADPDGFTNLRYTYVLINGTLTGTNGCYITYVRSANALYLLTDDATTGLGPVTPGTSGTVQNSQCVLSGTGSSVAGSGTNLTVTVALTFKSAFAGTKNVYMNAEDIAAASSGWTSRGTWTIVSGNQPPTAVSVFPNSGTGLNATLAFTYSDPNGFTDLSYTFVLINNVFDSRSSCYIVYSRAGNGLYLLTDDSVTTMGPVIPGSTGTVQNSQCIVNGQGSSVSGSGNNLTVTVSVTFNSSFSGTKNVYMNAQDAAGATSGWTAAMGTWTPTPLVNQPPTTVSVSPASGTGLNATLALTYADPDGFTNLRYTYVLINGALDARNGCYITYVRAANTLYLLTDDAVTGMGPITPGVAGTVQNSQCTLSGTGSSVSGSGTNLTVTLALTFKSAFTGTKSVFMNAEDAAGASSGWTSRGTWTPVSSGNQPPVTVSVTPSSGTGLNASLALAYSDPNGFTDLSYTYVLVNNILDAHSACYVIYSRAANALYLLTDDSVTGLGPVTPGSPGTVQNSQCTVNGQGSSVAGSGNNLTVTVALTFSNTFTGTKNIYMNAQDASGATSGWTTNGTWTPSPLVNQPPTTVSVSPATGTGLNATLALTYADPDGFANLRYTYALINSTLTGVNGCYITYVRSANALYLLTDDATTGMGPVTPGTAGTVQNSQCILSGTGSSVVGSGTNLTVTVALTFKSVFTGAKNVYMNAEDIAGAVSGWTSRGGWTPSTAAVAGTASRDSNVNVAPFAIRMPPLKVRTNGPAWARPTFPGAVSLPVMSGPDSLLGVSRTLPLSGSGLPK